ncbi:MAG TPA: hypothetical protein VIC60_01010 [Thermomicrobiales bacterium]
MDCLTYQVGARNCPEGLYTPDDGTGATEGGIIDRSMDGGQCAPTIPAATQR